MNSANINLEEIIKRKIGYYKNNTDDELQRLNFGYIRAFEQMLEDIHLNEDEFVKKYSEICKTLGEAFELNRETLEFDIIAHETIVEHVEKNLEELSGYNNGIVDILSLFDYNYLFAD